MYGLLRSVVMVVVVLGWLWWELGWVFDEVMKLSELLIR